MSDSLRFTPPLDPVAINQSATRWAVEIGRFRVAVTRTRETRGAGLVPPWLPRAAARPFWPIATGAFASISALALLVVGAGATRPVETGRYMLSVPVPSAPVRHVARSHHRPAPGLAAPRTLAPPNMTAGGDPFEAADKLYVDQAMQTGAFQEWRDAAGQQRFLTAGPPRAVGGKTCRDMALLIRFAEGGSRVHTAERCTTAPVSDADPAPLPATDSTQ